MPDPIDPDQQDGAAIQAPGGGVAIASLVLGIVSIIPCLAPLTGIPAVITGILGLKGPRRGMGIAGIIMGVVGMLIAGLLTMTVAMGWSKLKSQGINLNVMAVIQSIQQEQRRLHSAAQIDQDMDGTGEFGLLEDFQPQNLFPSMDRATWTAYGYHFRVYVPDSAGGGIADPAAREADPMGADLRERHWVVYAWPMDFAEPGVRTLAMTTDGKYRTSQLKMVPSWDSIFEGGTWGDQPLWAELGSDDDLDTEVK